jgi:plasmid rolling circle replication initiator protein Rep
MSSDDKKTVLNQSIKGGSQKEHLPGPITIEDYAETMNSCSNLLKTWSRSQL